MEKDGNKTATELAIYAERGNQIGFLDCLVVALNNITSVIDEHLDAHEGYDVKFDDYIAHVRNTLNDLRIDVALKSNDLERDALRFEAERAAAQ
jgi:hypothetical protein